MSSPPRLCILARRLTILSAINQGSAVASPSPAPGSPPNKDAPKSSTAAPKSKPSVPSTSKPAPAPVPAPSTSTSAPTPKRRESLNGAPRTHKTDGLQFGQGEGCTGDKTREKCAEMIYDALASDSDARSSLLSSLSLPPPADRVASEQPPT